MAFGKAYEPPKVDWTGKPPAPPKPPEGGAPAYRSNSQWAAIKDVLLPFGEASGANDPKEFGYWFNYFWTEAREAYDLDPAAQAQLCDAFYAVLQSDGKGGFKPSDKFDSLDYVQLQLILIKVLRVGFKRIELSGPVPVSNPGKAAAFPNTPRVGGFKLPKVGVPRAVDARALFVLEVEKVDKFKHPNASPRTMEIGFRGDSRSWPELVQSGFLSRARSKAYPVYEKYGMNLPWHPFSLQVYANSLFCRKGKSRDNCLHTVISVASNLTEILPYPLLSDGTLFRLAFKDPASWDPNDISYVQNHWLGLQRVNLPSGALDYLTTVKNIYVLDMSMGKAFNTEDWQGSKWQGKALVDNPFPERAVDQVLPEQVLAQLTVCKKYYYQQSSARDASTGQNAVHSVIVLFEVERISLDFVQGEEYVTQRLGPLAVTDIRNVVDNQVKSANDRLAGERDAYRKARSAPATTHKSGASRGVCQFCGKEVANLKIHQPGCTQNPAKKAFAFTPPPPPNQ
jgi:hypothetical protein